MNLIYDILARIFNPAFSRLQSGLDNLNAKVDEMGAKQEAALAALDDLIAKGDETLAKVQAWQAADDEQDAAAIQERTVKLQKQQEDLNSVAGVSTTVNPSQPVDAVSGENLPPAEPVTP